MMIISLGFCDMCVQVDTVLNDVGCVKLMWGVVCGIEDVED